MGTWFINKRRVRNSAMANLVPVRREVVGREGDVACLFSEPHGV